MASAKIHKLKSSVMSRGFSLAKMTLGASTQLAAHGVSQLLKTDQEKQENWKGFVRDQALRLTTELGQLKGSLMKAGQMVSMLGEHFLPPEANEFLKSLQSQSPYLIWPEIEKCLKAELSPELLSELEISEEPVAAASLGQVHRATVKSTGQKLALKVQYPGVEKAIDSDLRAIKSLLSLLKLLPRDVQTDALFQEVKSMLEQETNYQKEAELTGLYSKLLAGDSRFVVPQIVPRYSTKKLLSESFEDGLRADDPGILSLPQERRNTLAQNFLELYFMEIFSWGLVQTDPHVGNYKVRLGEKDALVLLDFGATRRFGQEFLEKYKRMIRASLFGNKSDLISAAQDLKFLDPDDPEALVEAFMDFCFATVEPFIEPSDPRNAQALVSPDGVYDWKNTDLPQRLSKKVFQLIRNFKTRTPPEEVLFLDRKTGGVFVFLSVLGARIESRSLLLKYLAGPSTEKDANSQVKLGKI